jgi:hypothetical protein
MSDDMPCTACDGHGRVPLSQELQDSLDKVREGGVETAEDLWKTMAKGLWKTAAVNRLERLRTLGYLERTKRGRTWHYSARTAAQVVEVKKRQRR